MDARTGYFIPGRDGMGAGMGLENYSATAATAAAVIPLKVMFFLCVFVQKGSFSWKVAAGGSAAAHIHCVYSQRKKLRECPSLKCLYLVPDPSLLRKKSPCGNAPSLKCLYHAFLELFAWVDKYHAFWELFAWVDNPPIVWSGWRGSIWIGEVVCMLFGIN